jgi:hypothetical protein
MNLIGQRTAAYIIAPVLFTTNVVLATVGLVSSISAGGRKKIRAWIPITVGATGGVRSQVVVPAGGTLLNVTTKLYNTVAPSLTTSSSTAVFTSALANAGTHWLEIEAEIENGVNAGQVDVQLAQNTSDANTLTVLQGGWSDITNF